MTDRLSLVVAAILCIGIVLGIVIPAGPGWDFANFYDAGHKVLAGQTADLYDATVPIEGRKPQGHLPYYGAPLTAALLAPLALLPPAAAMVAFKIQNTAALLLALWLLYSWNLPTALKAGLNPTQYRALFLGAALLFQPFWTIYRVGGQTTPTVLLGFVLALRWFTTGRMLPAALCMVAAVAIKPAFIFTLAILAIFGGMRFFAWTAACGLTAAALSVLTMGWTLHQRFLTHIAENKISPWTYNSSLSVFVDNLYSITGSSPALRLAGMVIRLLAAVLILLVLLRGRRQPYWIFFGAIAIGVVLMPIVWEHYLSVLFLPVSYLLAKLPQLARTEIVLLALVCGFCFTQNLVLVIALNAWWQPRGVAALLAAALYKSAPLLLFISLLWRYRTRLTESSPTV